MSPVEKLLKLAEAEVGYCEKSKDATLKNPKILDEKFSGAGADNYNKYARNLLNLIGSPYSQGTPWCDMFVDDMFVSAFGVKLAKEIIGGWSAYTPTSAQMYKDMGRWFSEPEVGDQIFFKNSSRICHTGIVCKVDKLTVYTIEGNTSTNVGLVPNGGSVALKSYSLKYSKIAGYGRPKYELAEEPKKKPYLYKGVDVSATQKNLDYNKLKQAGVEFGIIKIIRKDLTPDLMFEKHYSGFLNAQIPVFCVYNYSYATTVEKAKKDAQVVISTLSGRRVAVCLDVEDNCQKSLGKGLVDIINAYQHEIESAGLPFLLYTGMSFYNSYIKPYRQYLKSDDVWMARYYKGNTPMTFNEDPDQGKCPMINLIGWQYTSKGQVSGCNGDIDLDIIYRDIESVPTVVAKNITTTVRTKNGKLNIRKSPINGVVVDKLSKGTVVNVLDIDYSSGWYKIGDNRYVSPDYIESNTMGVIITAVLNIRNSDSTKGDIVGKYYKDYTVSILAQSSTGWYLTPKGWASNNYIRRI